MVALRTDRQSIKTRIWLRAIVVTVIASLAGVGIAVPAHAVSAGQDGIDSIVLDGVHSTIELGFDDSVSPKEAEEIRAALAASPNGPGFSTMQNGHELGCGHSVAIFDSNGRFDIAYNCSGRRTLPWGFRLSSQVQAIIVGPVNEDGLRWWRNGVSQPQNAPHTVPASYQFHGTMRPVSAGDDVDYQDYMTFRHNVGPGGTGSVAFAGSVLLTN